MAVNAFPLHEGLEPVSQFDQNAQYLKVPVDTDTPQYISQQQHSYPQKRIFGLRATTFWLSLALFIVVIAGVIGGAVGGSYANANKCVGW